MLFSRTFFIVSVFAAVMWIQATAGAVDKSTLHVLEQQQSGFEAGRSDDTAVMKNNEVNMNNKKIDKEISRQIHEAGKEQQEQLTQQRQQVDMKPSFGIEDSLRFVMQTLLQFSDSKKNEGEDQDAQQGENDKKNEGEKKRDPLTSAISTVAVIVAISLWVYTRNAESARLQRRRRHLLLNSKKRNNSARGGNNNKTSSSASWPPSSTVEEGDEDGSSPAAGGEDGDEDLDDFDLENEQIMEEIEEAVSGNSRSLSAQYRRGHGSTSPMDDDAESNDGSVVKPAAISSADASAVLISCDDEPLGPCRAKTAARRCFVEKGGIVRTVALVVRTPSGRVVFRRDGASGSLSLPSHAPVKFCLEELNSVTGSLYAASRAAREEFSRILMTSASASSSSLHTAEAALSLVDAALAPSNMRLVARTQWVAPGHRSHEVVHLVAVTLANDVSSALEKMVNERENDGLFVGRDSLSYVSQSDLASGVLSLHPLLQSLLSGHADVANGLLFGRETPSPQNIIRLISREDKASLPTVPAMKLTRVGGPVSSIPFVTKIHYFSSMVKMKLSMKARKHEDADEQWCFEILTKVSRSFAMVIENLCEELRTPTCIYYLVLRALDTVEDDVHISREEKERHLKAFDRYLDSPDSVPDEIRGYGDGGYLELMKDFDRVVRVHNRLRKHYQKTICATTRRMAEGMLLFLDSQNKIAQHSDYNEYCFYVAGLVGLGLSDMFVDSGLEPDLVPPPGSGPHIEAPVKATVSASYSGTSGAKASACAMALMLQKTNILRDYKEDIDDARLWWPHEVWGCYAREAADFQTPEKRAAGLACLNHLIVDAMRHLPACLDYLQRIHDPSVFSFCAVPQAMAIATLTTCFNNENVFHRNVKISKGEACASVLACKDVKTFARWARAYVAELRKKTDSNPILFANARSALAAAELSLDKWAA